VKLISDVCCVSKDHKPDSESERERIERCGGEVIVKAGVSRVVWKRPRETPGFRRRSITRTESIPFLAVARSLGQCLHLITGPPNGPVLFCLLASAIVVCNAAGGPGAYVCRPLPGWPRGQSGGRHCTAGQYSYVPLRRHLVNSLVMCDVVFDATFSSIVVFKYNDK